MTDARQIMLKSLDLKAGVAIDCEDHELDIVHMVRGLDDQVVAAIVENDVGDQYCVNLLRITVH